MRLALTLATLASLVAPAMAAPLADTGAGYRIYWPPAQMVERIERAMQDGTAPAYTPVPRATLNRACDGMEYKVLACVYETAVGKTVFVINTAKGRELHMLLVHEYAHYLYGWRH